MCIQILLVHPHGHDDLLERRVARALAQAVDGALDLRRAIADGLECKGCGHAQIVMRVDRNRNVLDAGHALAQIANTSTKLPRHVIARGVRNIHDRSAGLDRCLDNADQELLIGAARILGIKLDIVDKLTSVLYGVNSALDSLILGHMELVTQMAGAHTQTGMDTGPLSRLEGFCGHFDILIDRTGETAYRAPVTRDLANLLYGTIITGARDRKSRLDHVDIHTYQLACNNELFLGIHAGAGRLLPVTKRCVKDCDFAAHDFLLTG